MPDAVYRWRGTNGLSLEVLRLHVDGTGSRAHSRLLDAGARPFAVDYRWALDRTWRTRSLVVRVHEGRTRTLAIERTGDTRWRVDGTAAPNLDGCDEIDLSITPFCNTLALRRFGDPPGGAGEITALYVCFPGEYEGLFQRIDEFSGDEPSIPV